jgi:Calcineurin-like phosphoesterase
MFSFVLLLATLLAAGVAVAQTRGAENGTWKFAVSGDSRNCGDIVMPAIAASVISNGAEFYWHLGDFRAMSNFDEDYRRTHPNASISKYFQDAWPDFIQHQLVPFGKTPVYLGIGNHELVSPMTRGQYIAQFADWLDQPTLQQQRLSDDPANHLLTTYYHWVKGGVDFINMDNASTDMFDSAEMSWFKKVLANDAKDSAVKTVVLGMHAALPDSSSAGHSMNDSPQQLATGRKVYAQLSAFRKNAKKNVYVVASHSHFVMNDAYNTACHKDDVLPGWIMGSAGAVRYRLPTDRALSTIDKTDVYAYLLGTVSADGSIHFEVQEVHQSDVPDSVVKEFTPEQVKWCFEQNKSDYRPANPTCNTSNDEE